MVRKTGALDLYPDEMLHTTESTTEETAVALGVASDPTGVYAATAEAVEQPDAYAATVAKLSQPLDRRLVKQRDGYGIDKRTGKQKVLDYLEHHTVTRAMNRIFGYGRWGQQVVAVQDFFDPTANDGIPRAVRVIVSVHISAPGFSDYEPMSEVGYCAVTPKSVYKDGRPTGEVVYTWAAYEMALGNAKAKAFKKACAQYGDQFGLSLYGDDEDPDREETENQASGVSKPALHAVPSTTARSYDEDEAAECEECGKEIRGYTNRSTGKVYTTQDLVNISKRTAQGRILCIDCRR